MLVIFLQAKFVWEKTQKGGASKKKIKVFSEKEVRKEISRFFEFRQKGRSREHGGPGF